MATYVGVPYTVLGLEEAVRTYNIRLNNFYANPFHNSGTSENEVHLARSNQFWTSLGAVIFLAPFAL